MEPIRLSGPADVLAVLPYQLGYHPSDSLVALALRDRQIGLVERIDLPPEDAVDAACAAMVPPLVREEPDGVLLVGYESRPGAAMPLADAVRDDLVAAGVVVLDRLVVRDGRWHTPDCTTGCCPTAGHDQEVPRDAAAVAPFVALEVAPLPGRESLAALVTADPALTAPVAAALADLGARADSRASGDRAVAVRRLRFLATWARALDVSDRSEAGAGSGAGARSGVGARRGAGERGEPGGRAPSRARSRRRHPGDRGSLGPGGDVLTPDDIALLVASLRDVQLRDGLIAWVCPGTLPLEALSPDVVDALHSCLPEPVWDRRRGQDDAVVAGRRVVRRLQEVVRAVPDEEAAALLTVLANLAWWLGDGALTRVALDRALAASPGYRLARLLEQMVDLGLRTRSGAGSPAGTGLSA